MANSGDTYHAPGLRGPELQDLRELNAEMKLMCTEQQLEEMAGMLTEVTKSYQRVSEMVDPTTPLVKYPRTPGYRPDPKDNPYNAWAWRCDIQGAVKGKLAGKTFAIKDNIAVAGVPMRNGSKLFENYVPEFDATVVSRILDAGGRIIGKSALEDMCIDGGSITCSDGPVLNPVDDSCVSGGSSSGSGALVASDLVDMAIGGDQGGSVRIPASFTGTVGLKPTWGLVPYTGAFAVEPTVDHLGPMTKTVTDCALLLEVIAGYDEGRDSRQFQSMVVPEYSKLIDQDVKGKKIGLLKEGFDLCTEEVVKTVVSDAACSLTKAGCIVSEVSVPMHVDGKAIFSVSAAHGTFKYVYESNGTGYFNKGFCPTSMQQALYRGLKTCPQDLHSFFEFFTLHNCYISRLYGNRFYGKGQNLAYELSRRYDAALKEFDVLILPTLTCTAPKIPPADCSFRDLLKICYSHNGNTRPFNITGHPALSVNAGFSAPDLVQNRGRLPIGMMIVGRKFDEVTVLQVARAFEKLTEKL